MKLIQTEAGELLLYTVFSWNLLTQIMEEKSRQRILFIVYFAAPRVFRFPVFRKEFCKDFIEELEHFEQSDAPKGRPNTMNNYGVHIFIIHT